MDDSVFRGCMPAVMSPVDADGRLRADRLVDKSKRLIDDGMSGVVYCGSMGDWPLLSRADRMSGVAALAEAGVPVVVGTGAVSTAEACEHARHARKVGAAGLMIIPRLLSRGTSSAAQSNHFARVLTAGEGLPSVIYNSPYYGYQTRGELYFRLRDQFENLVGFKEFGGAESLRYAAEHMTSDANGGMLLVGVDTQVFYGIVDCGAVGAITGIGNCLPKPVLRLVELCKRAAGGDAQSRRSAMQLDAALKVLSTFDEGPDLTLYYRRIAAEMGDDDLARPVDPEDRLSRSQEAYALNQLSLFLDWYESSGIGG